VYFAGGLRLLRGKVGTREMVSRHAAGEANQPDKALSQSAMARPGDYVLWWKVRRVLKDFVFQLKYVGRPLVCLGFLFSA
jgi:hypothetical protein